MNFRIRSIGISCMVAAFASAHAGSAQASATADFTDWISGAGADISYSSSNNQPGVGEDTVYNYGPGNHSFSSSTGSLGSPSSSALASATGFSAAGVEVNSSDFWNFFNSGSNAESVTINYTASLFASQQVSDLAHQSASAYSYAGYAGSFDNWQNFYGIGGVAYLPPNSSGTWSGSGSFTISVGSQQWATVMMQSGVGVQAFSSTPEPAPIAALGIGALGLIVRKRRK